MSRYVYFAYKKKKTNSVALVREQIIPTERPPSVGEVSANFLRIEGCHVVSATDPHGRWSLFSGPEPLLFIQVDPQLTSRGWVDPVPDPLLLRKSGSTGNRTRDLCICSQKLWPLDHRGGLYFAYTWSISFAVSRSRCSRNICDNVWLWFRTC